MVCSKCGIHFPDQPYSLDGGQGHDFVESARRPLSNEEAAWYEGSEFYVTYTCSACEFSYNDVE